MLITIKTSGGFAGIGLPGKDKSVDTSALPGARADEVCKAFDPARLAKLAAKDASGSDRFTYHIAVTDKSGEKRRFDIPEAALSADLLDLIDEF